MNKKKMVAYRLPPELLEDIEYTAKIQGLSNTGFIEKCVEYYLFVKILDNMSRGAEKWTLL